MRTSSLFRPPFRPHNANVIRLDLQFWYGSAFGSPVARVQGIGWIQEMVARLTHTPIETHNSSTNSTLNDNKVTFPLDHSLYVDATHEVVVLNSQFSYFHASRGGCLHVIASHHGAESDELRQVRSATVHTHPAQPVLPRRRARAIRDERPVPVYVPLLVTSSALPPLTLHLHAVLECTFTPGPQIRVIINDGVAPLTGIEGCPEEKDGMCPLDVFVAAQKKTIAETDWNWDCHGDWEVPSGPEWETLTGSPPARQ